MIVENLDLQIGIWVPPLPWLHIYTTIRLCEHISGLDPNNEATEGNGTHDQPTPTTKLPQARERAQLLSNYAPEHS